MKRAIRKELSVFLVLLLLVCSIPLGGLTPLPEVNAADPLVSGIFTYTLNTSGTSATITKCDASATGIVTVPDTVDGIPVKTIGSYAFKDAVGITEIVLPASISNLYANAFANPNLRTVNISTSPTYFMQSAFNECPKLEAINIDAENASNSSADGVLYDKSGTTVKLYPMGKTDKTFTLPSTVTSIGMNAICNNPYLENIIFPEGFLKITQLGIINCAALKGFTLPDSFNSFYVNTAQGAAVENCPALDFYTVSADNATYSTVDGVLYNKAGTTLIKYPGGKADTSFTVPSSVTEIGFMAFENADLLESVTVPDTVTKYNKKMFFGCDKLETVNLGNGSKDLWDYMFGGCVSLKNFTVPDSVVKIYPNCFNNCASLEKVTLGAKVKHFPTDSPYSASAFINTPSLTEFAVSPANTLFKAVDGVVYNKSMTALVKVPEAYEADSFTIPATVTQLGCYSLADTDISEVIIPESVNKLGDYAFSNCDNLTELTVPAAVSYIGFGALSSCDALDSLSIKGELTYLADNFAADTVVTDFEFTDSAKYISVDGMVIEVSSSELIKCMSDIKLVSCEIPPCVKIINKAAFKDCNNIMSLVIPETVTTVASQAFTNNKCLTDISVPGTATKTSVDSFGKWSYSVAVSDTEYSELLSDKKDKLVELAELTERYEQAKTAGYDTAGIETQIADVRTEIKVCNTNIDAALIPQEALVTYPVLYVEAPAGSSAANNSENLGAIVQEPVEEPCAHTNTRTVPAVPVSCTSDGYTEAVYCEDCLIKLSGGEYIGPATGHTFGSWTSTATCTEAGLITRTCVDCQLAESQAAAALGHDFSNEYTVDVNPDCINDGSSSRHCSRCEATTDITSIPATGIHSFTEWTEILPDTETSYGIERRICRVCDVCENRMIPMGTNDRTDEWVIHVAPTCTNPGLRRLYYGPMGEYIEEAVPVTDHSFGEWEEILPDTAISDGVERRTCTNCDAYEDRAIPMGTNDRTGEWQIHTGATCTNPGLRRLYYGAGGEYVEEVVPASGHSFGVWFTVYEASCSSEGLERRVCSECGATEENALPTTSHIDRDYNCACDNCGAAVDSVKPHGANCFCYKYENNQFFSVLCQIFSLVRDILDTIFI